MKTGNDDQAENLLKPIQHDTDVGKHHSAVVRPIDPAQLPRMLQSAIGKYKARFEAERNLVWEGDECGSILYVIEGWLALYKSLPDGGVQIIDFALPGDLVDPSGADGVTASLTVQAFTDGAVAALPYRLWERMLHESRHLYALVHHLDTARGARRAERMLRVGKGAAEMRVAYALLEFCIRIDAIMDENTPNFHIPITQQQLGDFIGLSSVHVCRTMRRMNRNGIIEMSDHMLIRVLDLKALSAIAGVDWHELKRDILPDASNHSTFA